MYTLLLIDDDAEVLSIHEKYFIGKGYAVHLALNAEDGLRLLGSHSFDCILLDVMMPGIDGIEACRQIRKSTDAPVLFLTGCLDEISKVRGLASGADDYIAKPCSLVELEARVAANIRRSARLASSESQALHLYFSPLEIDVVGHRAYCNGEALPLTSREYDLLYLLVTHHGKTVTYEQIGRLLLGTYQETDRRLVMVSISRLRKKLENSHVPTWMIETDWGRGYQFIGRKAYG